MDTVFIKDLSISTHIGVPEKERAAAQKLHVSLEMVTDVSVVSETDDISKGIDYDAVCCTVRELAKTERKTVEKFAEDIAKAVLDEFGADIVHVRIDKFIISDAGSVGVEITRTQQ